MQMATGCVSQIKKIVKKIPYNFLGQIKVHFK